MINLPCYENEKLKKILERVNSNIRLQAYWDCSNKVAVDRLRINDHGKVHVAIVANIAIRLLRNIIEAKISPSVVKDHGFENEDAEAIVFLASVLHDIGHAIHRDEHQWFSIPLGLDMIHDLIDGIYDEREKTIITSEVLHAIISHHHNFKPLTIEAGILCVSDALDMKQGRARIPFIEGKRDIHQVSALAIQDVQISSTEERPIVIKIEMDNSAGIFQVDALLKRKIENSGLKKYISVIAEIKDKTEKKILDRYEYH